MQEEAKVSNSLTQVTHDMESQTQALEAQAEEYKQAQADLLSAQEVASEAQKAYQAAQASLQISWIATKRRISLIKSSIRTIKKLKRRCLTSWITLRVKKLAVKV